MEASKDIVLSSYYEFDQRVGDIANLFFEKSGYTRNHKKVKLLGGSSSYRSVLSPIHIGKFSRKNKRCKMTLAHELGHGGTPILSNKKGLFLADTPLTLAETASVFGEMLTFKSPLKILRVRAKRFISEIKN